MEQINYRHLYQNNSIDDMLDEKHFVEVVDTSAARWQIRMDVTFQESWFPNHRAVKPSVNYRIII